MRISDNGIKISSYVWPFLIVLGCLLVVFGIHNVLRYSYNIDGVDYYTFKSRVGEAVVLFGGCLLFTAYKIRESVNRRVIVIRNHLLDNQASDEETKWLKHMSRRHLLLLTGIALAALTIALGVLIWHNGKIRSSQSSNSMLSSPVQVDCSFDSNNFLNQLNGLRASIGQTPLVYDSRLEQAANAHIDDMVQYDYYGHTNPITKNGAQFFVDKFAPGHGAGEILDAPNIADDAFTRFKNSPDHYQNMVSVNSKYIGIAHRCFRDGQFVARDYDNNGNVDGPEAYLFNIVVADFAN